MSDKVEIREADAAQKRGVNIAAAIAREQLRYAEAIAAESTRAGHTPEPVLVGALLTAIASNYANINK